MAEGIENPGLEALLDCRRQVEASISEDIYEVADFLRTQAIIDLKLYHAVTDSTSYKTGKDRARILFRQLELMVEEDEKYYEIFTEYLRQYPDKFAKTINMLDKAYSENGGIISYATDSASRTKLNQSHYSELCEQLTPVHFAWEDIARSLGFHPYEIAAIRGNLRCAMSSDYIFYVIEFYLRWAPGDGRGSKDVATLEALQAALDENNCGIKLSIMSEADQQSCCTSERGTRTELNTEHYSMLCQQLVPAKMAWENIARTLGFHHYEIAAIKGNLMITMSGNYIFDVIEFYLRWSPGDGRGSKDVATLEALQDALDENNFEFIKLQI